VALQWVAYASVSMLDTLEKYNSDLLYSYQQRLAVDGLLDFHY
jgi:hypothetical protein